MSHTLNIFTWHIMECNFAICWIDGIISYFAFVPEIIFNTLWQKDASFYNHWNVPYRTVWYVNFRKKMWVKCFWSQKYCKYRVLSFGKKKLAFDENSMCINSYKFIGKSGRNPLFSHKTIGGNESLFCYSISKNSCDTPAEYDANNNLSVNTVVFHCKCKLHYCWRWAFFGHSMRYHLQ